jgi:excisionase family DNA binding protein
MPEVARRLGVTEYQACEMGRRGELPTVAVGERLVRVRAGALEEWIHRRETGRTMKGSGGR